MAGYAIFSKYSSCISLGIPTEISVQPLGLCLGRHSSNISSESFILSFLGEASHGRLEFSYEIFHTDNCSGISHQKALFCDSTCSTPRINADHIGGDETDYKKSASCSFSSTKPSFDYVDSSAVHHVRSDGGYGYGYYFSFDDGFFDDNGHDDYTPHDDFSPSDDTPAPSDDSPDDNTQQDDNYTYDDYYYASKSPTPSKQKPSKSPSAKPPSPTRRPSERPTSAPEKCPAYSASATSYDTVNYASCLVTACPGADLVLNGCNAECVGDQYFVLYDQAGSEVAVNDDGTSAGCGLCAEIKYSATQACQVYSLHEGCYSDDSCEGEVEVTGGTVTFSLAPTPAPYIFDCAAYSATNTNSDLSNYVTCNVYACPESTLTLSGCNSACVGDQYLRLYSASGAEVNSNDDGCGDGAYSLCSQIVYRTTEACQTYALHEGCYGDDSCGGVISVTGASPPPRQRFLRA